MEGRDLPKGNSRGEVQGRTQSRKILPLNLARVNEAAKRDRKARFTALLHHVDVWALLRAFHRLKRRASPGVDGETVAHYEQNVWDNLKELCLRIQTGRYRPQPVWRVFIPKADGGQRPLGVPTLEDKLVQSAVAEVLSAVYEVDFLGFSYGFRPGRNPHQALTALHTGLMTQNVNWVLDADFRKFFDSVNNEWLLRMIAHRVADQRILRLIRLWLEAGVFEDGRWCSTEEGTPQGSSISPLLANVFLHYVLDLWVHQWRRRHARGRVIIVRYADDFVMGFQYSGDAQAMAAALRERVGEFSLTLHEEKTRLLEFGRLPSLARQRSGLRRCATFAFLGFTHYCGRTRDGRFVVKRQTQSKRLSKKLQDLRQDAQRRRHESVADQHAWLSQVLRGHYAYYGLPSNFRSLRTFYEQVRKLWYRALRRRSQRGLTWDRFKAIPERFTLPRPKITHPVLPRLA
ncbi:MAG: group II intron reverse transcriptase/maturase [Planctomycetota bacterium]|nr:group II intron reverse transcriptase/maturase [Planctomycetota bacterium]